MDRYIVFDVETPNYKNNRMSAIGITVVENREILEERYYLVNPECEFGQFNIDLTGITPEMVESEKTFPKVWEEIKDIFESGTLIAHNAQFDMSVLAKCLNDYGIAWKYFADYACTCTIGKKVYPDFPNHRLNTMCDILGFSLDHHNAGSDSSACAKILIDYLNAGVDISLFKREYNIEKVCTVKK